jgi:hypothetical protein
MLKSPSVGLAILALSAAAATAQPLALDLTGAWQVTGELNAGEQVARATPVCTFKQTGAQVAGACEGPHAQGPVTGQVAGRHVSWQWRASPKTIVGMNGVASFEGDLGADNLIHGTWTTSQTSGTKGTFSAQRR